MRIGAVRGAAGFIARYGDLSAARTFYCGLSVKEEEPLEGILFFTCACSGQVSSPLRGQIYSRSGELFRIVSGASRNFSGHLGEKI